MGILNRIFREKEVEISPDQEDALRDIELKEYLFEATKLAKERGIKRARRDYGK